QVPASLNFREPNPRIPLDALRIRVQGDGGPWPRPDRPLVAGVSSFGMGGTNCHLVLEQAPERDRDPAETTMEKGGAPSIPPLPSPLPLVFSAKAAPALADAAERLADHLSERPELDVEDVAYSLATTRSSFERRAAVVGRNREELLAALTALADGEEDST